MTMRMTSKLRSVGSAALAVGVLATTACNDGLTDLNVNPNDPVDVPADFLFANAVEASVSRAIGTSLNVDLTGLWVQHYAEFEIPIEDTYELTDERVASHWSGFYTGPLQDLQIVIEKGREANRPNTEATATIMKVWTAQMLTDLYGDIPYSQALRVRDPEVGINVAFDTQEDVYQALISDAAGAVGMFDPDGVLFEDGDILYGGDVEAWQRFGNTLRMRLAMRLADVAPDYAEEQFVAAYNAGGFESNADNALLRYLDNGSNRNPIHVLYLGTGVKHSVSKTLVDTLAALDDPRLAVYAQTNDYGEYRGAPNASLPHEPIDSVSLIGTAYSSADTPGKLLTYAEALFLQAEAAERGWITASAAALYEAGIRASMEYNGVDEADIVAYLAHPAVVYQGGDEGMAQIAFQKWVELFGNGVEAYAEWRRTGHPVLPIGPDAVNGGQIPVRLFYPASESSLNQANVDAAIARQDGATLNTPVWWDPNGDDGQ